MASIKKRNKTWYIQFSRGTGKDRVVKHFSLRTKSKQTAIRHLSRFNELESQRKINPFADGFRLNLNTDSRPSENIWIEKAVERFLASLVHRSKSTQKNYRLYLNKFMRDTESQFDLIDQVSTDKLYHFVNNGEHSENHSRCLHRHLKRFFNWCIEQKYIKSNPMKRVACPRAVDTRAAKMLRPAEFAKLMQTYEKVERDRRLESKYYSLDWFKPLIFMYNVTGMRKRELLSLNVSDIREESGFVQDTKSKKWKGFYIPDEVQREINIYLDKRGNPPGDAPAFVSSKTGRRLYHRRVNDVFNMLLEKAGIDSRRTIHGLRHKFVTDAILNGIPTSIVRDAAGHTTTAVTQGYEQLAGRDVINSLRAYHMNKKRE